jgi:hypothetical protein
LVRDREPTYVPGEIITLAGDVTFRLSPKTDPSEIKTKKARQLHVSLDITIAFTGEREKDLLRQKTSAHKIAVLPNECKRCEQYHSTKYPPR